MKAPGPPHLRHRKLIKRIWELQGKAHVTLAPVGDPVDRRPSPKFKKVGDWGKERRGGFGAIVDREEQANSAAKGTKENPGTRFASQKVGSERREFSHFITPTLEAAYCEWDGNLQAVKWNHRPGAPS